LKKPHPKLDIKKQNSDIQNLLPGKRGNCRSDYSITIDLNTNIKVFCEALKKKQSAGGIPIECRITSKGRSNPTYESALFLMVNWSYKAFKK